MKKVALRNFAKFTGKQAFSCKLCAISKNTFSTEHLRTTAFEFYRKTPMLESFLNKVEACNFVKKSLQHRCFFVKFAEILRAPSLKNICKRLLLHAKILLHKERVRYVYKLKETDAATASVLSVLRVSVFAEDW